MLKVDLIVKSEHFYTMEGDGTGYREKQAMIVKDGAIFSIEPYRGIENKYEAESVLDLKHHVVLPGFIDAHMHTGDCIFRGVAQDTNNWMMYGYGPFSNVLKKEAGEYGSRLAITEAIKSGTTTFGDFEKDMEFVCQFIYDIGVRGNIASTIREAKRKTYHPGELYEFDEKMGYESLQENLDLYNKWHNKGNGRIKILFGPQGADFVSKDMLMEIQRIAKEKNTKIHMHLQQGDRETYQVEKRYGKRPISWLDGIGFLDDTLISVHLTDATDEEARLVAEKGASMILCPGSIGIIDGIVPPSKAFQDAGGFVALGSDQAPGNNCHNIFNEMKLGALFNKIKYKNPEVMPAWKMLRMATIEGAKAIGLGNMIGSLEKGKRADFIAVDLNQTTMQPVFTKPMRNMVPNLVYSARGSEVSHVAVDGKLIYKEGTLLTINEKDLLPEIRKYADEIGELASEEFWKINGTNAQFMRENKL